MGDSLTAHAARPNAGAGEAAPRRRGPSWLAAIPFALAWTFAAATLNAALAPAVLDPPGAPGREAAPAPPPPPAPPAHDLVFDASELISV